MGDASHPCRFGPAGVRRAPTGALVALCLVGLAAGARSQVRLSEVMLDNQTSLTDARGATPPWIEIHNPTSEAIDLGGYVLATGESENERWTLPALSLPGGGYVLVIHETRATKFAPSLLRSTAPFDATTRTIRLSDAAGQVIDDWRIDPQSVRPDQSLGRPQSYVRHELVTRPCETRFLVPEDDGADATWAAPDFDDSTWTSAPTALGFDFTVGRPYAAVIKTDLATKLRFHGTVIYTRSAFTVSDPAALPFLVLDLRFDQGFVATLNGVEIARTNAPERLTWDATSDGYRFMEHALVPERFAIAGADRLLVPGRNVLAIAGLTPTRSARRFLLDWRLDGFTAAPLDMRETPLYLAEPSPLAPNGEGRGAIADPPTISLASGLYTDAVTLELAPPESGGTVHYTLNGSLPDETSPAATGAIALQASAFVQARTFAEGALPSPIASRYVARLATELDGWSSNLPVFVVSTFGRPLTPGEYTKAHVHLVEPGEDGRARLTDAPTYSGNAALKIRGSSTQNLPKKGYSLELRDERGEDLDAALCGLPAHSDWVLYAAYNFDKALIRNTFVYEMSRRYGRYAPRTRFCEVFVNTGVGRVQERDYVGVYALIERIRRDRDRVAVESLPPDAETEPEISGGYILKIDRPDPGDSGIKIGDERFYLVYPKERDIPPKQLAWITRYLQATDDAIRGVEGATPGDVERLIDIESFIDYHILQELTKNPDAFILSTYMHKPRDGALRMGPLWDFDRAMRTNIDSTWVGSPPDPWGWSEVRRSLWWGPLLDDPAFAERYWRRWLEQRRGPLAREALHAIVDAQAAELTEAVVRNFKRWPVLTDKTWEEEIASIKWWLDERLAWEDGALLPAPSCTPPGGLAPMPLVVACHLAPEAGPAELWFTTDGTDPRSHDGEPAIGAQMWGGDLTIDQPTRVNVRARYSLWIWSALVTAPFVDRLPTLSLAEVMFASPEGEEADFIELVNHGDAPLALAGMKITSGVRFDFDESQVRELAPGARLLVVADLQAFAETYDVRRLLIAGEYSGRLDETEEETIVLEGGFGENICELTFDGTWLTEAEESGASIELVDPAKAVTPEEVRARWRPSTVAGGTPGRAPTPSPAE